MRDFRVCDLCEHYLYCTRVRLPCTLPGYTVYCCVTVTLLIGIPNLLVLYFLPSRTFFPKATFKHLWRLVPLI